MLKRNDDFLIMMVKCLYDVHSMLNEGTREQLKRVNLISIKAYCSSCMGYMVEEDGDTMYQAMMALNAVIELCAAKLQEPGFCETDMDEKQFIVSNVFKAEGELCLVAGKYYTSEHTFPYTPSLNEIYKHIVDVCISNNYYFGIDKQILEGVL